MPLNNVTPSSFDHSCAECGAQRQALPHSEVKHIPIVDTGKDSLVVICPDGHIEIFNLALDASHETDERYSEIHQHQALQIRLLKEAHGIKA